MESLELKEPNFSWKMSKDLIPGYLIIEETTKTNTSKIFKAMREDLKQTEAGSSNQQLYAIKVSNSIYHHTDSLLKEYEVLKTLEHDHIIQPKEVGKWIIEDFEYPYMITEFSDKGDLYEWVTSQGHLDEASARTYFKQILKALKYLHDKDIVHRDLKLQNVVITKDEVLQLIDFGFAHSLNSDDSPSNSSCIKMKSRGDIKGTQGYISPEILEAQAKLSKWEGDKDLYDSTSVDSPDENLPIILVDLKKADIFSLGVILFEMVIGLPPFLNANAQDSWYRLFYFKRRLSQFWSIHPKAKEFISQNKISDSLQDLIEKLLTPFPKLRPTLEEIEQHPWMTEI